MAPGAAATALPDCGPPDAEADAAARAIAGSASPLAVAPPDADALGALSVTMESKPAVAEARPAAEASGATSETVLPEMATDAEPAPEAVAALKMKAGSASPTALPGDELPPVAIALAAVKAMVPEAPAIAEAEPDALAAGAESPIEGDAWAEAAAAPELLAVGVESVMAAVAEARAMPPPVAPAFAAANVKAGSAAPVALPGMPPPGASPNSSVRRIVAAGLSSSHCPLRHVGARSFSQVLSTRDDAERAHGARGRQRHSLPPLETLSTARRTSSVTSARILSRAGRMNGRAAIFDVPNSRGAECSALLLTSAVRGETSAASMLSASVPVSLCGGSPGLDGKCLCFFVFVPEAEPRVIEICASTTIALAPANRALPISRSISGPERRFSRAMCAFAPFNGML